MTQRYDVYGLGHALVDMVYEVEDEFLKAIGVEKGRMELVDAEQQQGLREQLAMRSALRACGGSAANSLIAVAQYGGKAWHACRVAGDETGQFYAADMRENGVINRVESGAPGVSGQCLVFITPDAERTMCTFLGESANFSSADLDEAELAAAQYVYVEGYLVTGPDALQAALDALAMARKHGVKSAFTFSDANIVKFFREAFGKLLDPAPVDLIFANEDEAKEFAETDDIEAAKAALKQHCRAFAVTRGADGVDLWDGENDLHVPGKPAKAIDTNGAGDLFAGSFLYGITQGWDFARAARLANAACAELVTQYGARLSAEQAQRILAAQGKG
ncbi:adenosine kinase [Magnetofaba australis]|uniref:Putative ribokinase-like domain-containing protein n=1 Tax=Magnetofaba australis IT-1 TaxID=1434232 RepID=A0A1Y2K7W0_9PROT|nr:adenosine kinase [Magnetofaba australis]OSM06830.1 putative ribokinase-like domain-containing protein [Magnetofaba australis IT-1]